MDASEIITEAQIRSGVTDVASRADHYVRGAERLLEKRLRVGAMEKTAILTADMNGGLTLPDDFLQWRSTGTGDLTGIAGRWRVGEVVPLRYYARIPSVLLGPNWLSESEPEVYIQAVLLQIYTAQGMADEAVATNTLLTALLDGIEEADLRARYVNRSIDYRGLMP